MKRFLLMMWVAIAMASCFNVNANASNKSASKTQKVVVTDIKWQKEANNRDYKVVSLSDGREFELVETRILGHDGGDIVTSKKTWRMYFSLSACQVGDTLTKVCQKNTYYYAENAECPQQPTFTIVDRRQINGAMCYLLSNNALVIISPKLGGWVCNYDANGNPNLSAEKAMMKSFKTAQVGTKAICRGEFFYVAKN